MKIWKSPVFYFGILLVVAVAGLLIAPFVIDWNSYRADLENYGRKLTGREVSIDGEISAKLFPWPRLTAENIRIANPTGIDQPVFASADRMVVRMTLAALFRGGIDVEAIEIERPVIQFERRATGEGNWIFSPAEDLVNSKLLSRVSLDGITITDGTVRFADRRRGEVHQLDDFNATLSAPGLGGPWRMRSVSLYRGQSLDIGVTTGIWKSEEPFRFGVRVAAADGSGLVFGFDGAGHDGLAEGNLRIEPATTGDGKGDAEGQLRPLVFTAKVKASFNDVKLDEIEIAPRDLAQGGAITTGSASLTLGRHITANADFSAAMLDLDDLAGAGARKLVRDVGSLALAGQLLDFLPGDMSLAGRLNVTSLKAGGETLDNVKLDVSADRNAIRIGEFSAGLPGRSRTLFKGRLLPSETGPELAGSLALESSDLRQLVLWGWSDARDMISSTWTGSRGQFKLQTDVSATLSRFELSNSRFEIDGDQGSGGLVVSAGGRQAIDIRIDGKRFDIDNFIPQGLSAVSDVGSLGVHGLWSLVQPAKDAPDLRVTLQAGELLLNGVRASDVALDFTSSANGLYLRALDIGSVGGARLEANGLILDSGRGADGAVGVNVQAEDPRGLLRLLGIIHGDSDPIWSMRLGQTTLKGNLTVKPEDKGSNVSFDVNGTAGPLRISGTGEVNAALNISTDLRVSSASSADLVRLFGPEPVTPTDTPGEIAIKAAGTAADGYMATVSVQAFGAVASYTGAVEPFAPGLGLDGRLVVRATDARPLIEATGLPVSSVPDGILAFDSALKFADNKFTLPNIEGQIGEAHIKGNIEADQMRKVSGHVETGRVALRDVLSAVFLDWSGPMPGLSSGFRNGMPFGLTGELWIKPEVLTVHSHFEARDAEIAISAADNQISANVFGKDTTGRNVQVDLVSRGSDERRKLEGLVNIPIDLQHQLLLAGGQPVASGQGVIEVKFEADGRSPGGALASLRGSGSYGFDDLKLLGLSPADFAAVLAQAKDSASITAALDALRGGDGLDFGKSNGTVTITNGEVALLPITLRSDDVDATINTVAELALGEIDASVTLGLKARPNLPVMIVSYVGPPSELARNEDNTELSTMLGVTLMQEGVDELERLQQEQKRLIEAEKRQRLEDEERLQAYYAQRDELLMRRRELKVHAELRVLEAERVRKILEAERAANSAINLDELKQRAREVRVLRRLAKLAAATPVPEPPKPKKPPVEPKKPAPEKPRAETTGPVILAKPETAPVVISPEPGLSPSQ